MRDPSRLKILFIVLVIAAASYSYTPLRLTVLVLAGRGHGCNVIQAIRSPGNLQRQLDLKESILSSSRLLKADPAGYSLWHTPQGRFWVPQGSDSVLASLLAEEERKVYGTGERAVKDGDIVLDCGANVGVYTREALVEGARLVVAIEPAPENLECLRRNLADEVRRGRVLIYPKGVWDKDALLTLNMDASNWSAGSVVIRPPKAHPGPPVPLTTIDKLVWELRLERVDFIKLDIEGAEERALAGAQHTLRTFHPRLAVAAYHRRYDPEQLPEAIRGAWPGYRVECGPCADVQTFVRPDMLYFR